MTLEICSFPAGHSHTAQAEAIPSVALAPVPNTRVTESAKGTGGPRSQASRDLQPPPDQPQPPRNGLPGASVPSTGLRLRPLSEAAFSHPTPHLLSLTPHLRSSLPPGEPGGAPRLSVMRSAGLPGDRRRSCFPAHSCPAQTGRMTEWPLQGRAWPVSRWWDEVRSTHPPRGDSARGSGWDRRGLGAWTFIREGNWATNSSWGAGVGAKVASFNASEPLALGGHKSVLRLPPQEGRSKSVDAGVRASWPHL